MRRQNFISVKVKAPSRGLITRFPGETADNLATGVDKFNLAGMQNRASSVGSNVRYENGVVKNAPGYDRVNLVASILEDLLAHWRLNETSDSRLDATLNHFDLTEQAGSVTYSAAHVSQVSGKFQEAARFSALVAPATPPITGLTPGSPAIIPSTIVFSITAGGSTDSSHRVLLYGFDSGGSTPVVQVINSAADTTVSVTNPSNPNTPSCAVYAENVQKFFVGFTSGNFQWSVYDLTGAITSTLDLTTEAGINTLSPFLAYGPETGKIYSVGDIGGGHVQVLEVDPSDNSRVSHDVDISSFDGGYTFSAGRVMYAPGYLFIEMSNWVTAIRLSDFTAVGLLPLPNGFNHGFCYNPVNGKIYLGYLQDITFDTSVIEISFPAMTIDFEYILPTFAVDRAELHFDPTQTRIIVCGTSSPYAVLDPTLQTIIQTTNIVTVNGLGFPTGAALDSNLGKLYVPNTTLSHDIGVFQ